MDFLVASTTTAAILLSLAISGTSASTDCGIISCPNLLNKIHDAITDESSKSFCCKTNDFGVPYCCDWKDYAVFAVGLDPNNLAIPVGAIIGIVVGGVVLLILMSICCCFCCSCCCFRGRKRVITQHHTVQYVLWPLPFLVFLFLLSMFGQYMGFPPLQVPTTTSSILPATTSAGNVFGAGPSHHNSYAPLTNEDGIPRPGQALYPASSAQYTSPPPYNPNYNGNHKY